MLIEPVVGMLAVYPGMILGSLPFGKCDRVDKSTCQEAHQQPMLNALRCTVCLIAAKVVRLLPASFW